MESTILSLFIIGTFGLLAMFVLSFLVLRLLKTLESQTTIHQEETNLLISNHQGSLEAHSALMTETTLKSLNELSSLTDKLIAMLGTKDPIAFQQVQAMNSASVSQEPVDNSDHGETLQWLAGQELDAHEKEMFSGYSEI